MSQWAFISTNQPQTKKQHLLGAAFLTMLGIKYAQVPCPTSRVNARATTTSARA